MREYSDVDFSTLTDAEKYTIMTALGQSRSERAHDLYQRLTAPPETPAVLPVLEYPYAGQRLPMDTWAR